MMDIVKETVFSRHNGQMPIHTHRACDSMHKFSQNKSRIKSGKWAQSPTQAKRLFANDNFGKRRNQFSSIK